MDKHQDALVKLIHDLVELDPVCSVIAVGSVGRADYHPESDMDINVVTWRYREIPEQLSWDYSQEMDNLDGVRVDEGYVNGIKTHLNCSTPANYQGLIMHAPVWSWGGSRVLHDPSGIAEWGEQNIRQFFADNPRIAEECRRFHDEYLRHKKDKSTPRRFQTQGDFFRSLDLSDVRITYESFTNKTLEATLDSALDPGRSAPEERRP